jgi:hypothetical protein
MTIWLFLEFLDTWLFRRTAIFIEDEIVEIIHAEYGYNLFLDITFFY